MQARCREDNLPTRGVVVGYANRPCYFLVDYGESDNEEGVPVLWYAWAGKGNPLYAPPDHLTHVAVD